MTKATQATTMTELAHILVETLTRDSSTRHTITLKNNKLKAAIVWCRKNNVTRVWLDQAFQDYEQERINQVFSEFYSWKRVHNPHRLARFSGRTKTGETHPWRKNPFRS